MAIKILITLEGSEEVKSSLNEMAKSGEAFMQQFEGLSAKAPLAEFSSDIAKAKPAIESASQVSHGFAESLRIVIPSLRLAGVEVGNFAGFTRLASVGIGGLAAAAGGAIVVALARLEDTARTTRGQLEDLFQSKTLSEKAFAGIQASALQFNTTIGSIVPGIEALKVAWDKFVAETRTFKFVAPTGAADIGQIIPPGMTGSIESLQTAYNNFLKLLRAGRLDQGNATKAAEAFFKAMQDGGKVTAEMLRSLPTGTVNQLAQAMGRGQISTQQFINEVKLAPIQIDKLLGALNRFGLESDAAFRANAIVTYKDKLGEILNTLSEGFKKIAGISFSDFVVKQLEGINQGIKNSLAEWEKLKALIEWIEQHTEIPFVGKLTQKAREGAAAIGVPGTGIAPPEATTEENNRAWEAAGISAKERFAKGFRDAPAAAGDIGKTLKDDLDKAAQQVGPAIDKFTKDLSLTGPTGILPSWQEFLSILQKIPPLLKNIPSNIIPPAGAAEFTPSPLLQQQQQAAQTTQATQPIVAPFQEADQQIRTIWQALVKYIADSLTSIDFSPLTQALVKPFTEALPGIRDALLQVESMIKEIIRQALEAGQIIQQLNQGGRPGGGGGRGFIEIASGGYIRGPGTTTSDSIPAWLSNREYVIQARAVDHYGANLFAALNSMRLPKDLLGHFALGGLAKALSNAMPRYASGGMATATASTGRSLTIVLDGQRFGLNGSADVIDKLERVATMAGIASIGRPPGWVR